jgi:hypothetical protein
MKLVLDLLIEILLDLTAFQDIAFDQHAGFLGFRLAQIPRIE